MKWTDANFAKEEKPLEKEERPDGNKRVDILYLTLAEQFRQQGLPRQLQVTKSISGKEV